MRTTPLDHEPLAGIFPSGPHARQSAPDGWTSRVAQGVSADPETSRANGERQVRVRGLLPMAMMSSVRRQAVSSPRSLRQGRAGETPVVFGEADRLMLSRFLVGRFGKRRVAYPGCGLGVFIICGSRPRGLIFLLTCAGASCRLPRRGGLPGSIPDPHYPMSHEPARHVKVATSVGMGQSGTEGSSSAPDRDSSRPKVWPRRATPRFS